MSDNTLWLTTEPKSELIITAYWQWLTAFYIHTAVGKIKPKYHTHHPPLRISRQNTLSTHMEFNAKLPPPWDFQGSGKNLKISPRSSTGGCMDIKCNEPSEAFVRGVLACFPRIMRETFSARYGIKVVNDVSCRLIICTMT